MQNFSPEKLDVFTMAGNAGNFMKTAAIAIATAAGGLIIKSIFDQVEHGHVALRTRNGKLFKKNGKPYGVVGPGLVRRVPLISGLKKIGIRERPPVEFEAEIIEKGEEKQSLQKRVGVSVGWSVLN